MLSGISTKVETRIVKLIEIAIKRQLFPEGIIIIS